VEIKIVEDHPNPLLKRREYRFEIAHPTAATPSREDVRGELSKLIRAPKDRVIIERMAARYGTATTLGDALVYETADAAKSITREHILIRNGLKEKAVKGATPPAEAAATEAPKSTPAAESPKAESPAESAPSPKSEPKSEHKPEHKPESKPEAPPEHKSDHKAEHRPEHKGEHKSGDRAEKASEGAAESKSEPHKGEHKPKAAKPAKDTAAPKEE
jgi:small subunit ribosomal protein S24e